MSKIVDEIRLKNNNNMIKFSEEYYRSSDNKTIMGEVPLKEILFFDYRETEAGSNPREYNGLKKTNLKILKSLLEDQNMFRILHSGIIVSLVNPIFIDKKTIRYEDCCLTNGNQTRFIILLIVLIKLLRKIGETNTILKSEFHLLVKKHFSDNESIRALIDCVKLKKLNEIVSFFKRNNRFLQYFNKLDLKNLLDTKIRIQINLINAVMEDSEESVDSYAIGTLIAEANNDTQNVKVDDIFGTKNKEELNKKIFCGFNALYKGKVQIEFRMGETPEKQQKVHILTLLRPVVATGIITKENDIFTFTNQRIPVYRLFNKLFRKDNVQNTISAISKLIPVVYKIRVDHVEPILQKQRREFIRGYKEKALSGELTNSRIASEIKEVIDNDDALEKIIKRNVNYNIEHIIPVLVFRIRKLFEEAPNGVLYLTIPKKKRMDFFEGLIESIYKKYIEKKLIGLPTSLTTVVREKSFYEFGDDTYIAFKRVLKLRETDYIEQNRHII